MSEKIKSKYILKIIFSNLNEKQKLIIIKYNKNLKFNIIKYLNFNIINNIILIFE